MDEKAKKLSLSIDGPVLEKLSGLCGENEPVICKVLEKWIRYSAEPENRDILERCCHEVLHPNAYDPDQLYALPITGAGHLYSNHINYYFDKIKEIDTFFGAFNLRVLENESLYGLHRAYVSYLNTKRLTGYKFPGKFYPKLMPVELIREGNYLFGPRIWVMRDYGNSVIAKASLIEVNSRIIRKGDTYCKAMRVHLKNLECSRNGEPFMPVTQTSQGPYDGFWNVGYIDGEWCRMRLHREVWAMADKGEAASRVSECEDHELEYVSSVFLPI